MAEQFDAEDIDVIADGEQVADLDSVGYDQSKDHELQRTMDGNAIFVIAKGEYELTVVVKAPSDSRPTLENLFENDEIFDIAVKYAPQEPRDESVFSEGMLTDFSPSDYELDGMPTFEGTFVCEEIIHS